MHCLLEGLAQYHTWGVLNLMVIEVAFARLELPLAFKYTFATADSLFGLILKEIKQVQDIHNLLTTFIENNGMIGKYLQVLEKKLSSKSYNSLRFIYNSLGLIPIIVPYKHYLPHICKINWIKKLLN
jgi:hypothetical protein